MKIEKKIIKLEEALKFAKENGYLLAVYKRIQNNFNLIADYFTDEVPEDTLIVVDLVDNHYTDFNEFTTEDKKFCFRLHNNFNVPKIIPIFDIVVLRRK